jgi:hypothetical protein
MHSSAVEPTGFDHQESLKTARRRALPDRRTHVTQNVWIGRDRVLYLTVHDDPHPAEVFLRVKGPDVTSETVALYDVIARLLSVSLQYGASLEKLADLLSGTKFAPCEPLTGHARIKACTSLPDFIGRYLLLEYCGREDVAHVPSSKPSQAPP